MWLKRICNELKIPIASSMKVLCDNQSTISTTKNPVHHDKTKHVEIDRHFIVKNHRIFSNLSPSFLVNYFPSFLYFYLFPFCVFLTYKIGRTYTVFY